MLDGFTSRQEKSGAATPAVVLYEVEGAVIRNPGALPATGTFLRFTGKRTGDIVLDGNDLRKVRVPYSADSDVPKGAIGAVR